MIRSALKFAWRLVAAATPGLKRPPRAVLIFSVRKSNHQLQKILVLSFGCLLLLLNQKSSNEEDSFLRGSWLRQNDIPNCQQEYEAFTIHNRYVRVIKIYWLHLFQLANKYSHICYFLCNNFAAQNFNPRDYLKSYFLINSKPNVFLYF